MEKPDKNNAALLLRLPADLKVELVKQAYANGRRITAEINTRLRESLKPAAAPSALPPSYTETNASKTLPANERGPANTLSNIDQAMLEIFRALPPEKQLGLLALFK